MSTPKDALVCVAAFADALRVLGTGRGGKPRDEELSGAALEAYVGKRARKGRRQDAMQKAMRVVAAAAPEGGASLRSRLDHPSPSTRGAP